MVRNRNGYWMDSRFCMAPDDGGGAGGAGGDNPAGNDPNGGAGGEGGAGAAGVDGKDGKDGGAGAQGAKDLEAQIEQLKSEMAKQKAALDAATSEAGKYKKELRAKQTQAEIDEANKKEAEEKRDKELADLRKEVARAKSTKSVMSKLGMDEENAGKIAECLAGCEDIENALLLIKQAWDAKEKALRLEFGKIPGPGAGGSSEEDAEEKAAIELGKKLGRGQAEKNKSVANGLQGYMR